MLRVQGFRVLGLRVKGSLAKFAAMGRFAAAFDLLVAPRSVSRCSAPGNPSWRFRVAITKLYMYVAYICICIYVCICMFYPPADPPFPPRVQNKYIYIYIYYMCIHLFFKKRGGGSAILSFWGCHRKMNGVKEVSSDARLHYLVVNDGTDSCSRPLS